eukprot:scaffold5259_cov168-Ochromonas_danica.AAC.10
MLSNISPSLTDSYSMHDIINGDDDNYNTDDYEDDYYYYYYYESYSDDKDDDNNNDILASTTTDEEEEEEDGGLNSKGSQEAEDNANANALSENKKASVRVKPSDNNAPKYLRGTKRGKVHYKTF